MKVGVHLFNFTWPGGPQRLAQDLTRVAHAAEVNGFDKLSVMEHLWQAVHSGPPENEMLEAYTTLGYLAARTTRIRLLALVTAVVFREPGLLAKAVTTLDVLSEGRAWLGVTHYQGPVPNVASITPLQLLGQRVIPVAAEL
jgi:alkanesulfonate monooxygenase SsuD/methylene tetrahydromethanopterin reductase-like flavin-dependent oxidoreductase (luciferase family)